MFLLIIMFPKGDSCKRKLDTQYDDFSIFIVKSVVRVRVHNSEGARLRAHLHAATTASVDRATTYVKPLRAVAP